MMLRGGLVFARRCGLVGRRGFAKEVIDVEYESGEEEDASFVESALPLAERVRSLVELRISGTLSSIAVKMKTPGTQPEDEDDAAPSDSPPLWASIMPYVIHESKPVFGVFPEERHSANLFLHTKASLVVGILDLTS
jgi:hypothetical protein